jgi:hypothetical protein
MIKSMNIIIKPHSSDSKCTARKTENINATGQVGVITQDMQGL